ncbi:uncharacterized protein LOC101458074 [Ceratitis capitata]|uniref:(Mediterranean fruit fly) hypothetical protein n=1 Tax=Ceratitis capitata TaxID=7213 RepID=W8AMX9_CERCA|nr:uncharacterized protein LOC101458074 [Ceratitis capitata]CAD7013297.1 unnamed protein product [Ceratitis capitata]
MFSSANKSTIYGILLLLSLVWCNVKADDNSVDPATPRTCYSCEGINCLRVTKVNETTVCTDLLDYCVTVFRGFTVVARGCYGDLQSSYRDKCDLNDHPECMKCFGNRCNDKGRADFKCIECKSSEDKKCATETSAMTAVQCPVPTAQNSYCFVRESADEGTIRGCFVHQRDQEECLSDTKCSMCLSDDAEACNSYKVLTAETAGVSGVFSNMNVIAPTVILTVLASLVRSI